MTTEAPEVTTRETDMGARAANGSTEEVIATEEPTTEESATETPTTEEATTEEPTSEETPEPEELIEIGVPFDEILDYFRFDVEEIRKEGDTYVIAGDKIYGGIVVLTVDQKEALDKGALLKLMYGGEEVERIVIGQLEDGRPWYYSKNSESPFIHSSEFIETAQLGNQREAVINALEKAPFYGVGYYFDGEMIGMQYDLILERDVCWEPCSMCTRKTGRS